MFALINCASGKHNFVKFVMIYIIYIAIIPIFIHTKNNFFIMCNSEFQEALGECVRDIAMWFEGMVRTFHMKGSTV